MESDNLYNDPDLAQFYDIVNGWGDDLEYCRNFAAGRSVLDLGCGTGLFAATVAQEEERLVVGVDPAKAVLDIARQRPGGARVHWIQDDARSIRLDQRFDLIVLTGHAFQVFLTQGDRASVFRTIANHLTSKGRFIFDSRNPQVERWKGWTPTKTERLIEHPLLGQVLGWNDVSEDPATGIVTYETHYKVIADGRVYSSRSEIAFPSREELISLMCSAGLIVEMWLGDWSGAPCSRTAPDIIPIGRLR